MVGRDTIYTDSLGAFALEVEPVPVRLHVDEHYLPRRMPRTIPAHAGILDHVAFDTVEVVLVRHDTTRADIATTPIPIVMVSVGVDDGTFAGSPLEGVTVTLLAADTSTLAQRATDELGLVRFRPPDLPPPGDLYRVTLDGGYDAERYKCAEGIGRPFTAPDANAWGLAGFVCVDRHADIDSSLGARRWDPTRARRCTDGRSAPTRLGGKG